MREHKIKYEGELDLNGFVIPCYVLEDGTRILSGRGMQEALKMVDESEDNKPTSGTRLTRYLEQKSLLPYIYAGKSVDHFKPLECVRGDKQKISGYEATVLADICDGFLDARKHIKLSSRQKIIADQCELLIRAFARVGIIALVDEATGYQYDREKKELQAVFKAFVSDEILTWQRAFHLGFYKEIFRLWNIPFTEKNIRNKPLFLGHLTNRLVYKNMPKGVFVLDKLKKKTPKNEKGDFKYRLHQSLTKDIGREALKKVIYSVETLASISENRVEFEKHIANKYGQTEIPFDKYELLDKEPDETKPPPPSSGDDDLDNMMGEALNKGKPPEK